MTELVIVLGVSGARDIGFNKKRKELIIWTTLTTAWNKPKYWIIAAAVAFLYLLGCQKGKSSGKIKTLKGTLTNIKQAKTARDSLADSGRIKRLHDKYKR